MDATGRTDATARAGTSDDRPTITSLAPDRLEVTTTTEPDAEQAARPAEPLAVDPTGTAADDAAAPVAALDDADPENADPENAEPGNAEPGNAEPGNAEPGNAEPDNADPDDADPDNAEQPTPPQAREHPPIPEHSPVPHTDPTDTDRDLRRAARRLRNELAELSLALDLPEVAAARRERELMLAQLDDYLLPRLARMDAPLLAVIGGSTGAGKSTLTNSLARKIVSRSGVLRPTTRSPVLVHHPHDSGAFLTQRILPDLARITSEALEPLQPIDIDAPRITALRLMPHEGLTPGLALLDAPDIDSVVEANRDLAVQLLGAADLWLFVTTAARYGDATPWQMLRTAAERGVSIAVVLDRVPPESLREVRGHLARRLRDEGLGSSPMFVVPEAPLHDGLLPANVVAPLLRWLTRLAKDGTAREIVVRRTLTGTLDSLPQRARTLVAAAAEQEVAAHVLDTELNAVFATARSELTRAVAGGTVLSGEVIARWQELVTSGELVRHLERAAGRLTDRVLAAVRKLPPLPTEPLGKALTAAVRAVVDTGARDAVEQALARWRELPGGTGLIENASGADDPAVGAGRASRVERLARDWHAAVLRAVQATPAQPTVTGRTLTLRGESVAALVQFASFGGGRADLTDPAGIPTTGELPSAEVADAVAVARRVLGALYGEPAIQTLIDTARSDLRSRVEDMLKAERSTLKALLDRAAVRPGASDALHAAVKVVEDAR